MLRLFAALLLGCGCISLQAQTFYGEGATRWAYRVPLRLPAGAAPGSTVRANVDFNALLTQLGEDTSLVDFDERSPRVVRSGGALAGEQEFTDITFQDALDAAGNGRGEVRFILEDAVAAGDYLLYFDIVGNGVKPNNPAQVINGTFEQSNGSTPTRWTTSSVNARGNQHNEIQQSNINSTIDLSAGCASGAFSGLDNSPNNNGTTTRGQRWHLLGYRDRCEDGFDGNVEQIRLSRNISVPAGAAAGELEFFFHVQSYDGIDNDSRYDWFEISVDGINIDPRNLGIDNTTNPQLVIQSWRFGRSSYSTALLDFGWKRARLDLTPYAGRTVTLRVQSRHYASDNDYRAWIKLDDFSWSLVEATLGTPEGDGSNAAYFIISHDNNGIHCSPESIVVTAYDQNGNVKSNYSGGVFLTTQTGLGSWALTTGSGSFSDATADDGDAGYRFDPADGGQAVFSLSYPQGPPSLDIDVFQVSDASRRDDDSEGVLQYTPFGLLFSETPLADPPPPLPAPYAASALAGSTIAMYITAFGADPGQSQCRVITDYAGTKAIAFWAEYVNPGLLLRRMTVNGTGIAASEATAAPMRIAFSQGRARIAVRYKDVGRMRLHGLDAGATNPELPQGLRGSTDPFVSRPANFAISNVTNADGSLGNPGATAAAGPLFVAAGEPFAATITAIDTDGDAVPSFGRESQPESVQLEPAIVAPVGGALPAVATAGGIPAFSGGAARAMDLSWPEVGIINLRARVADGDYLGAGDTIGDYAGPVGRFFPHHFRSTPNAPQFATACAAGSFTYLGQDFDYSVAPQVVLVAESLGNTTTTNYRGGFFKLAPGSAQNQTYAAAAGTLDLSAWPNAPPAVTDNGNGSATLFFDPNVNLAFAQDALRVPFDAELTFSFEVRDGDGVTTLAAPVTIGTAGGIAFDNGRDIRTGRVRIDSAVGSELVALGVPMFVEYYQGPATGFAPNLADSCTQPVTVALGGFTQDLDAGESCVNDTGSPGSSGAGCATAGPPGQRYTSPPVAGSFNLWLAPPGQGNSGSTILTATVPSWLLFDWNQGSAGLEVPSALVTFGVFAGPQRRIYIRERY